MPDWTQPEFWVAMEPAVASKKRLAAAPHEAATLVELLAIPSRASVLDLACGSGRVAIALALRGFRVTGVDFTAPLIEAARTEAARLGADAEWVGADMRAFERPGAFDAAINMGSSFGLFEDEAEIVEVARRVRRSLRPGGAFLVEMVGREILARNWRDRWWIEDGDTIVLEERTVRDGWKQVDARWLVIKGGKRAELGATQRVFAAGELRDLLAEAGFASVDLYGGPNGAPYDDRARRLIAVARTER